MSKEKLEKKIPNNLEEAIEELKLNLSDNIEEIKQMSEDDFLSSAHFSLGMSLRNLWNLWWYEGHPYKDKGWSEEKPKLTEWFNNIDIFHADDMSGIILTSLYRNINNKPYDLNGQIKIYKKHWKDLGYKNGIFNTNK